MGNIKVLITIQVNILIIVLELNFSWFDILFCNVHQIVMKISSIHRNPISIDFFKLFSKDIIVYILSLLTVASDSDTIFGMVFPQNKFLKIHNDTRIEHVDYFHMTVDKSAKVWNSCDYVIEQFKEKCLVKNYNYAISQKRFIESRKSVEIKCSVIMWLNFFK